MSFHFFPGVDFSVLLNAYRAEIEMSKPLERSGIENET